MNGWRVAEVVEAWGLSNFPRDGDARLSRRRQI